MALKFVLIAATLGICATAVQGQTTTALPTIPTWGACKIQIHDNLPDYWRALWTGGGIVRGIPLH